MIWVVSLNSQHALQQHLCPLHARISIITPIHIHTQRHRTFVVVFIYCFAFFNIQIKRIPLALSVSLLVGIRKPWRLHMCSQENRILTQRNSTRSNIVKQTHGENSNITWFIYARIYWKQSQSMPLLFVARVGQMCQMLSGSHRVTFPVRPASFRLSARWLSLRWQASHA